MKNWKKLIIILLVCLLILGTAFVCIWHIIKKNRKRNAEEEYKIAKEIIWFCNYTGNNDSLESVCREIGKHTFNSEEAITSSFIRNGMRNGKRTTSFSRMDVKTGFFRCDLELTMNMDDITVQECGFTSVMFCIEEYDSLEKVVNYLPVKELRKNGTIWKGTIKCDDGRKKPFAVKLWRDQYYIFIDTTKEFAKLGGEMLEGIIE